jgi:hypothetical protein
MKWCLVKVFKTTNDVWKREVNWYYGKWTDREDGYPRNNNEIIDNQSVKAWRFTSHFVVF